MGRFVLYGACVSYFPLSFKTGLGKTSENLTIRKLKKKKTTTAKTTVGFAALFDFWTMGDIPP